MYIYLYVHSTSHQHKGKATKILHTYIRISKLAVGVTPITYYPAPVLLFEQQQRFRTNVAGRGHMRAITMSYLAQKRTWFYIF